MRVGSGGGAARTSVTVAAATPARAGRGGGARDDPEGPRDGCRRRRCGSISPSPQGEYAVAETVARSHLSSAPGPAAGVLHQSLPFRRRLVALDDQLFAHRSAVTAPSCALLPLLADDASAPRDRGPPRRPAILTSCRPIRRCTRGRACRTTDGGRSLRRRNLMGMASNGILPPNHVENGREFHGWRRGLYMYPCDEAEKDRMDIYHQIFLVARGTKLHKTPVVRSEDTRILDVGTGTGIWAIDMADRYSWAEVVGIDLVNIQPPTIPPNLRFRVPRDYESMWSLGEDSWDLIHLRMAAGGVSSWPEMYHKIFQHLKPRHGYLEQVEIDLEPRCDDGPVPQILTDWYRWLADATARGSKPIQYLHETPSIMRHQGFVDVNDQVIRLPFNTWPSDAPSQDVGRWYNLGLCEGMEAMCLGPFTRVYRWPVQDVKRLIEEVKVAICTKRYHIYHNAHIITARRP